MKLHEYITEIIAPIATKAVFENKSGGEIGIGQGNPKFENLSDSKRAMNEVYKTVASDLVGEYKNQLDQAFYEHKTLVFLTRGLGEESDKKVDEKIEIAQQKVQRAFKMYKLAEQANSYVQDFA